LDVLNVPDVLGIIAGNETVVELFSLFFT